MNFNTFNSLFTFKNVTILFSLIICMALFNAGFCATSSGGDMPWASGLEKLQASIEGPVATTICILGIVGCGAGLAFGGEMSQVIKTALILVLVCAIIVLASKFLRTVTGSSAVLSADSEVTVQMDNSDCLKEQVTL